MARSRHLTGDDRPAEDNLPGPNIEVKRVLDRLGRYRLFDALRGRRPRRFAKGLALTAGPLAFASSQRPDPLTTAEEAALAFAASGVTGYALAELPFQTDVHSNSGGGNIMTHFVGRTAPRAPEHDCRVRDPGAGTGA